MALVDRVVTDGLADQMVGDGPDIQVVLGQYLPTPVHIGLVRQRLVHLEMVAPTGELEPVVAPPGRQRAHLLERQIGPLAGEQCDWSRHNTSLVPSHAAQDQWCTGREGGRNFLTPTSATARIAASRKVAPPPEVAAAYGWSDREILCRTHGERKVALDPVRSGGGDPRPSGDPGWHPMGAGCRMV